MISESRTTYRNSTDKWSPALQIRTVLLSVQALLSAPNPDDPLATDVAKHYKVGASSLCIRFLSFTPAPLSL